MSLRIGIDVAGLRRPESGIGRYTGSLVGALVSGFPDDDVRGFVAGPPGDVREQLPLEVRLGTLPVPRRLLQWSWRALSWPAVESVIGPVDVFHTSDWAHPPQRSGAIVTTVHDLGPLDHPEWYAPGVVARHRAMNRETVARAHRIVTVSEFTRRRLIHHYPDAEGRVVSVPSGVAPEFRVGDSPTEEAAVPSPSVPEPFLLYVGSAEPRKNLPGLLRIFREIGGQDPDLHLVLAGVTGRGEAHGVDGSSVWTLDPVASAGLDDRLSARVKTLGLVDRRRLVALYRRAAAFVFPSLYEGFGLPVLEAMAAGCPVVASDVEAVAEVAGNAAVLADVGDESAFSRAVLDVAHSPDRRQELRAAGLDRAGGFSWGETARRTREAYVDALNAVRST